MYTLNVYAGNAFFILNFFSILLKNTDLTTFFVLALNFLNRIHVSSNEKNDFLSFDFSGRCQNTYKISYQIRKKKKKRRSGGARWAEICPPLPVPPPLKMLIKHNQRKHIEYTFFSQQKFHQIL